MSVKCPKIEAEITDIVNLMNQSSPINTMKEDRGNTSDEGHTVSEQIKRIEGDMIVIRP